MMAPAKGAGDDGEDETWVWAAHTTSAAQRGKTARQLPKEGTRTPWEVRMRVPVSVASARSTPASNDHRNHLTIACIDFDFIVFAVGGMNIGRFPLHRVQLEYQQPGRWLARFLGMKRAYWVMVTHPVGSFGLSC